MTWHNYKIFYIFFKFSWVRWGQCQRHNIRHHVMITVQMFNCVVHIITFWSPLNLLTKLKFIVSFNYCLEGIFLLHYNFASFAHLIDLNVNFIWEQRSFYYAELPFLTFFLPALHTDFTIDMARNHVYSSQICNYNYYFSILKFA